MFASGTSGPLGIWENRKSFSQLEEIGLLTSKKSRKVKEEEKRTRNGPQKTTIPGVSCGRTEEK
jgi:hypothetical protein